MSKHLTVCPCDTQTTISQSNTDTPYVQTAHLFTKSVASIPVTPTP